MASTTNAAATSGGASKPSGIETHKKFYLWFAAVLLLLYLAPLVLALVASVATDGFNRNHISLDYFATFLSQPDSTLNLFHKILFPIILGISTFAFRDKLPGQGVIALVILLLAGLAVSIFAAVAFDVPSVRKAMEELDGGPPASLVKSYFSRTQEVLLMYLMTILGLQAGNKKD